MVAGGKGKRNQNRRRPGGDQLRHRRRTRTTNHQPGASILRRHVVYERAHIDINAGLGISFAHTLKLSVGPIIYLEKYIYVEKGEIVNLGVIYLPILPDELP